MPELLIVTGSAVAPRQVARPLLLMVVLAGSEVDHFPRMSGIKGQLPSTVDESENCTWFPGAAALWSAVAFAGRMAVLMVQVALEMPQAATTAHIVRKIEKPGLANIAFLT